MNWLRIVFVCLCVAVPASKGSSHQASSTSQHVSASAGEIGSQLPSFTTVDLQKRKLTSADLQGKVALIDFWATWCQPCKKEMPGYQKLYARYRTRGLAVIGFKADVMADTVDPLQFLREVGVRYPIAIGSEEIRKKFGELQGLPTTFIYDRKGVLRSKVIGFEYTSTIEATIKRLL